MTLTSVVGIFAFAAGGSLLLSESMLGPDLLTEVTGIPVTSLYPLCAANLTVGAIAMRVGLHKEREFGHLQGRNHEESSINLTAKSGKLKVGDSTSSVRLSHKLQYII